MFKPKEAVEQQPKVVVTPPEDTTKETIDGLREDIKEQYLIQTNIARMGFWTYMRLQGVTEIPEGDFSEDFQKLIYASAERYPFALAPTEETGIDDGNIWLDNHPIPTGYDNVEPYEDFLDDLQELERLTRYRLKMDTMKEHGHTSMDVKKIESIGEYGHINVDSTPEEALKISNDLTQEEYEHLKQTATDYFTYRKIWLNPKYSRGLDEDVFDIRIIHFFDKKKNGNNGGDREERDLMDELNQFANEDDGCRV